MTLLFQKLDSLPSPPLVDSHEKKINLHSLNIDMNAAVYRSLPWMVYVDDIIIILLSFDDADGSYLNTLWGMCLFWKHYCRTMECTHPTHRAYFLRKSQKKFFAVFDKNEDS
jgi:hypothetical protein